MIVVCLRGSTGQTHQNGQFGHNMAIWFHPNLRAKFPSLILTGKREPHFPQKTIAPCHPPNHMLLVMRSIFRTGEVDVIWPNHRLWAVILTPPLWTDWSEKKGEAFSLSWPWITIWYFCSTKVWCMVPYFLCCCTQSSIKITRGHISPIFIIVVINSHAYGV